MDKKKIIIAAIALVLVIGVLLWVYFATRPEKPAAPMTPQEQEQGGRGITVTVVHKNGESKDFTYTTKEEHLGPVLRDNGLVVGHEDNGSFFIDEVDGEAAVWAEDQSYWQVFVGDEAAMVGVDEIPVTSDGVYKLVYTATAEQAVHSGGSND